MTTHDLHHGMAWDGQVASIRGRDAALALHVDGSPFARWNRVDAQAVRQPFPFTPSGHASMQLQWVADGVAEGPPVLVHMGSPGLHPLQAAPRAWVPRPLAPLPTSVEQRLAAMAARRAMDSATTIIVPIHNAAAAVSRCLTSIQNHTGHRARLLLIDDASSDPAIAHLLENIAQRAQTRVLRNAENLGFTATVNRGLRACGSEDVVLLNADTEVGPGWLGGLRRAAYSANDIASATAVSDNAGAFSVPEIECANALPAGWTHVDAARALLQEAGLNLPQLPTGNGFCMYMRADALADVGELDAEAFGQGYGEENDWCQRAQQRGWRHVIAGHVFVAHARSQSFGDTRRLQLGQQGMAVLRQRYPGYEAAVGEQLFSYRRQVLDWRVRRLWAAGVAPRPRVLCLGTHPNLEANAGEFWQVRLDSSVTLIDAAGSVRERCTLAALADEMLAWLQRYGFEVASGQFDGIDVETMCAALGITYVRT